MVTIRVGHPVECFYAPSFLNRTYVSEGTPAETASLRGPEFGSVREYGHLGVAQDGVVTCYSHHKRLTAFFLR